MEENITKEVNAPKESEHVVVNMHQEIDQDRYHPCPACEYCTRERIPDRCTCFRQCKKYRRWLKLTWETVVAPLRRAMQEPRTYTAPAKRAIKGGVSG